MTQEDSTSNGQGHKSLGRKRKALHIAETTGSDSLPRANTGRYLRVGNLPYEIKPEILIESMNESMRKNITCMGMENPVKNCVVCDGVAFVGFASPELAHQALNLNDFTCSGCQLRISLPKIIFSEKNWPPISVQRYLSNGERDWTSRGRPNRREIVSFSASKPSLRYRNLVKSSCRAVSADTSQFSP